jgi:hypothetical protein
MKNLLQPDVIMRVASARASTARSTSTSWAGSVTALEATLKAKGIQVVENKSYPG